MKKSSTLLLVAGILFCSTAFASGNHDDSAHVILKAKVEQMEKHIRLLQTEIKTLKSADSNHVADLSAIKQGVPTPKAKKLVIDRRGSKQALFQ